MQIRRGAACNYVQVVLLPERVVPLQQCDWLVALLPTTVPAG